MLCARTRNCLPRSVVAFHRLAQRQRTLHAVIIVRQGHVHRQAEELLDLLRRNHGPFLAAVHQHADAVTQIELLQVHVFFPRQVQRGYFRSAHQHDALGFVHDLQRVALEVARKIEAQNPVITAHELDQMADLRGFDAQVRV